MRRGLIEAFLGAYLPRRMGAGFRGECAAASLKHECVRIDARTLAFPRRMRRGLIEARSTISSSAAPRPFPRRMRRGLIEAGAGEKELAVIDQFPRRMRRGLIEARSTMPYE